MRTLCSLELIQTTCPCRFDILPRGTSLEILKSSDFGASNSSGAANGTHGVPETSVPGLDSAEVEVEPHRREQRATMFAAPPE